MKKILFFLVSLFFLFNVDVSAYFNMTVSPVKYEIETQPWEIVVKSATLYNYSEDTLYITTSTAEFVSDTNSWQPRIVWAQSDTSISHWITLHTQDFTIEPNSQRTINFDILIPDNATPGWHYGAVFFENDDSAVKDGSWVWVNVDYGVLLLVNVDGEVIKQWEVDGVRVSWGSSSSSSNNYTTKRKDSCPLWDFSRSNFDGLCIDKLAQWDNENTTIDLSDIWDLLPWNDDKDDDLDIKFEIPFENQWNTHIKPTGKITLTDEDWKQIKWVWKEVILNDNWAITGEKIVDYIPINDIWGNVLPQTKRIFEWEWKGFPYKTYDDAGNEIVLYADPSEYYTKQNIPENTVLGFWERVLQRQNQKVVTAQVQFAYDDINWEEIEFNSAEEFTIEYVDTYIWLNKYVISIGSFIVFLFGFLYLFAFLKKKKCKKCKKRIKRHLKACPYCGKKQKEDEIYIEKKDKKNKKNKEDKKLIAKKKNKKKK